MHLGHVSQLSTTIEVCTYELARIALALLIALAAAPASAQIAAEGTTLRRSAIRRAADAFASASAPRSRPAAALAATSWRWSRVPLECPEQEVKIVDEDFSSEVGEVTYRPLPGGEVKQMLITVPFLPNGATARAIVTAEVTTRTILPPEQTDDLKIPKKIPSKLRIYTNGSPYIEVKHQRIRSLSKEMFKDLDESATDWEKVEAIYDYVLENIDYVEGAGQRRDRSAARRPGRLPGPLGRVHRAVPGQQDSGPHGVGPRPRVPRVLSGTRRRDAASGKKIERPPGNWYPCESAGTRAFGEMPLARTILQKGDNFRVPERKEQLRYASDYMIGLPTPGGGKPKVKYIREVVTDGATTETEGETGSVELGEIRARR